MPLLLDGPMGTELARRGVDTSGDAWSASALATAPEIVGAIHRDYAAAGADIHTANTFRTTPRAAGPQWETLLRTAVRIARENTPTSARVAGSLAPLADCYRPDLSPAAPAAEQLQIVRALATSGVDLLLCETFPHVEEGLSAVRAGVRCGLETWIAWTAGFRGDLLSPQEMLEAARAAVDLGASAILVNCGPPETTHHYLESLACLSVPIGAYANAGDPSTGLGWEAPRDDAPARYARWAERWLDAGATILGGCCGTNPSHIRALRRCADDRSSAD